MEKKSDFDKSLRSLRRRYPGLYECDCAFLSRKSGAFRAFAEREIVCDLVGLAGVREQGEPFVLLFHRVGGCLIEARILLLLHRHLLGRDVRVVVVEPFYDEHGEIAKAIDQLRLLVEQDLGWTIFVFKHFDAYADRVVQGRALRADAIIVIDSDEREDLVFTLDSLPNHRAVHFLMQRFCRSVVYVARLGVDQCHGGFSRQLHRSIVLSFYQKQLLVIQLFSFGFDCLCFPYPFVWLDGYQLTTNEEYQLVAPLEEGGLLVLAVRRFALRSRFSAFYLYLKFFWGQEQ